MDARIPVGGALVTGGARRIGRAIVERLAGGGYPVALHASPRSREDAEREAASLRASGARVGVVCCDLQDLAGVQGLIAQAQACVGPIRLLVNNASVFEQDSVRTFDAATFERHMAVNLRAPIQLASAFAQALGEEEGCVVNVIDQRVWRLNADFFTYTLSKSALWTATKTMALAFAPKIRVNAVGPGPTLPNVMEGEDGFAREIAASPLKKPATPEAVAEAVYYLANASCVTGQMIAVDSGQHLGAD